MKRMLDVSYTPGLASSVWRIPIQIVGTPAVTVTFCSWKSSSKLTGSRWGPGNTCLTPVIVHA